jgi:iron complex outermembrane receptor protein
MWGALSRAVRMPTRFDTDLRIVVPGTSLLLLTGSEDFASENVIAYEAGYRLQPGDRVSLDLATYVNHYDDLRSQERPIAAGAPVVLANGLSARTSGAELSATLSPAAWWQLHASYSYLWKSFGRDVSSRDVTGGASEANDPAQLFSLRSYLDLPHRLELDGFVRYAGRRPQPPLDAYAEATIRLGWRIRTGWDLSLIGENLVHRHHLEFAAGTPLERFERAVHLRSTWHF